MPKGGGNIAAGFNFFSSIVETANKSKSKRCCRTQEAPDSVAVCTLACFRKRGQVSVWCTLLCPRELYASTLFGLPGASTWPRFTQPPSTELQSRARNAEDQMPLRRSNFTPSAGLPTSCTCLSGFCVGAQGPRSAFVGIDDDAMSHVPSSFCNKSNPQSSPS